MLYVARVIHTSFRLTEPMIERLDLVAAAIQKKQVGKVTRADILRLLVSDGLSRFEQQLLGLRPRKGDGEASEG